MPAAAATLTVPLAPSLAKARSAAAPRTAAKADPTDESLFTLAAAGNREALGVLVTRYEKGLYGLLVRITGGDRHLAEDLFQDTFLHAMRAAQTFNRRLQFRPWITAIAVNLVRDDARKRRIRSEVALGTETSDEDYNGRPVLIASDESPPEFAERQDEAERVKRAVEELSLLEREVVLLHFYSSMTLSETAEALGAPLGTIKSRLHAALVRLSALLEKPEP